MLKDFGVFSSVYEWILKKFRIQERRKVFILDFLETNALYTYYFNY